MCAQGAKCPMLHRVPTLNDEVETTIDCFGRDKHSDFRQDMGGVGGFASTNRTLYVGRITDVNEEKVRKHFSLWGEIARIHLLKGRGVAFIEYKSRANAEFAKEAMMSQSLDHNETINVRWATETQLRRDRIFEELKNSKLLNFDESELSTTNIDDENQQEYESELPAEFSTMKRPLEEEETLDEIKRQKQLNDLEENDNNNNNNNQYIYDQESTKALYGYTYDLQQQQYYQDYYHQQSINNNNNNENKTSTNPIISQNILQSLKSLSGNKPVSTSTSNITSSTQSASGGLGGLANYGSDSESDDE
ncbi:unnamed protein product [Cunninghamella blakesleeana]